MIIPFEVTRMRLLRPLMFVVCLTFCLFASAQDERWVPISPQEQQLKEVPGNPSAPAMLLYYSQNIDHATADNEAEFIYSRIKILNDKGKDLADVKIELPSGCKLAHLKAHTIHPDGKVIEVDDKAYQSAIIKGRGYKMMGASFTLPDVTVGSIIEYKYKLDYPPNQIIDAVWHVQGDLYALKEIFKFRAYTGEILNTVGSGISATYRLPPGLKPQRKGEGWELQAENIPAFESEAFMPPGDQFIYQVNFHYGGKEMRDADRFWFDLGTKRSLASEDYIGNSREIREAASQTVGDESNPEKQLRKLYARAQQIRNLTYERQRSSEELKKEGLRENHSAQDVLSHGYGDREDVTKLFVALARAAGFEATLVEASNRANSRFNKNLLVASQLDTEVAVVKLNGKDMYLDPGTRFCPFGMLRWIRTATEGLRLDKKGVSFVMLPPSDQTKAVIERNADVTLTPEGTLTGHITVHYWGIEALERRLDALETDEAGRNKQMEDALSERLPKGATVKLKDSKNLEGSDQAVEVTFSVEIPAYGSLAGKRILTPVNLFQTRHLDAFKQTERKFPVYFPYPFSEVDEVHLKVPAGFKVESVPQQQAVTLPYAGYQSVSQFDGTQVSTERQLVLNGILFPVERYSELKGFFNRVQAGDEQQAVLQEGAANGQKGN
jgi:hypothetical protein